MPKASKRKILAGRKAVDAYRQAHAELHSKPWHKGVPEEHTPLLEKMLYELAKQDFLTLKDFFDASDEFNIQELGFKDREDFEERARDENREALDGMWR